MALNIKNREVERLAAEVAEMANESKTEAIRKALDERKGRLQAEGLETRREAARRVLEEQIWPKIPREMFGKAPSKEEQEEILGFGPDGF